jgi:hypothetical protein
MKMGKGRSAVMIFPSVLPWYENTGLKLDPPEPKHSKEQYVTLTTA